MTRFFQIAFIICILFTNTILQAQNVTGMLVNTRDNNPYKKYMRPSLTVLLLQRNEDRWERMLKVIETSATPSKFNNNNIASSRISGISSASYTFTNDLEQQLTKDISRQIVAKWFNRNSKGEFNMDTIAERGMYNANDAEVIRAQASQRRMAILKDAGENLLDRSFILVYDIYNIKSAREAGTSSMSGKELEGYVCNFDCYLYQLEWNDSISSIFYNQLWTDASNSNPEKVKAFENTTFPIKYLGKTSNPFSEIQSTQYLDHASNSGKSLTDDELFANLYEEVVKVSNLSLAKINENFRVKASVLYTRPIAAKIGKKEDITTDKRFFAYELQVNKDGSRKAVRKGVVRATSTISDNRRVATGRSDTTTFYQVAGWKITEGMQLQENPDWGLALTLGYADMPSVGQGLNATLEINTSMWSNKLLSASNSKGLPPGIKLYGNFALGTRIIEPQDGSGEKYNNFSIVGGISKDLNFLHHFVLVPYVGGGIEKYSNTTDTAKRYDAVTLQIGCKFGVNIVHNIQIITNFSLNQLVGTVPSKNSIGTQAVADAIANERKPFQISFGLRYQY